MLFTWGYLATPSSVINALIWTVCTQKLNLMSPCKKKSASKKEENFQTGVSTRKKKMDDNPLDMYTKATKAWFPDEEEGWILGHLVTKSVEGGKVNMEFFIEARQKNVLIETTMEKLEASRYAELPPLKNPPILEGIDDLADLSYLHEYHH